MNIKETIINLLGEEKEEQRMTSRQNALSKRTLHERVIGEVYANHVGAAAPVPNVKHLRDPHIDIAAYMGLPPIVKQGSHEDTE